MNDLLPWSLLLLIVSTTLLALPFYPAWSEWRRPRDRQTRPVDPPPAQGEAPRILQIAPGACFGALHASHLVLGSGPMPQRPVMPELHRWQPPAGARPWGVHGWHIGHHLDIPADQLVVFKYEDQGVATLEDLHRLSELVGRGVEGAIVGKALYAGAFTLEQALELMEQLAQ